MNGIQISKMNPGAWQIGFEDNKSSSNCGYGLIQFTPAEDFLPKIGFSIDNIDEYIYYDVSLNQEKNAVNIFLPT